MRSVQENWDWEEELRPGAGVSGSAQSRVARLLIQKLSEECESYCILSGYSGLPDKFDSDIDFMVSARDFARIPALVDEIAEATGTCLFQVIPHEISARAFLLAARSKESLAFLQLDCCWDYRHFGELWLRADEVLGRRRRHPRGFWIPSAAYEFIYYLIKRVNKRDFTRAHGVRLSALYREDPEGCERNWRRFWSADYSNALTQMAASGDWQPMMWNIKHYRLELRGNSLERFPANVVSDCERARHSIERLMDPTGACVALIGPDGCGKSSILEGLATQFAPAFQKVVQFHLRPKVLPARANIDVSVTDPHGQPVRGAVFSAVKMLYLFADYWLGYASVRMATARTRLLIFDRYFYDILVDPKRVRYGGPKWLLNFLARLVPKPDLVLFLNASPKVLWSRKQEVPYEEVERQQWKYLDMARKMENAVVIDAAQSRGKVLLEAREAVLEYFSRRTERRLMLATTRSGKKKVSGRAE